MYNFIFLIVLLKFFFVFLLVIGILFVNIVLYLWGFVSILKLDFR